MDSPVLIPVFCFVLRVSHTIKILDYLIHSVEPYIPYWLLKVHLFPQLPKAENSLQGFQFEFWTRESAPFQFLQSPGSSLEKPLPHINFLFIRQLNKFTYWSEPGLYLYFLLNSYEKFKIAYTSVEVNTFKIGRLSSCVLPYLSNSVCGDMNNLLGEEPNKS